MKKYQLLIFDWDGTLVDSAGLVVEAVQKSAAKLGWQIPSAEEIRKYIGLDFSTLYQALFPRDAYKKFGKKFYHYFNEARLATYFFTGTITTLQLLKGQGYLLAIATNKGRTQLKTALTLAKIGELFVATRSPEDGYAKPDARVLLSLLVELGVNPAEALLIGDTIFDLQCAQGAGVDAVAVSYGHHAPEQLAAFKPVAFLKDIRELPQLLNCANNKSVS